MTDKLKLKTELGKLCKPRRTSLRGSDVHAKSNCLTLTLLTWTIWSAPTNASKWRMGFNSAFKGLKENKIRYLRKFKEDF